MSFNTSPYAQAHYRNATLAPSVWTAALSAITVPGRYRINLTVLADNAARVGAVDQRHKVWVRVDTGSGVQDIHITDEVCATAADASSGLLTYARAYEFTVAAAATLGTDVRYDAVMGQNYTFIASLERVG